MGTKKLSSKLTHLLIWGVVLQSIPIMTYMLVWLLANEDGGLDASVDWTASFVLASFVWILIPSYLQEYPWSIAKRRIFAVISYAVGYSLLASTILISSVIDLLIISRPDLSLSDIIKNPAAYQTVSTLFGVRNNTIYLLLVIGLAAVYLTVAHKQLLRPIKLRLMWRHQAQFSGFYSAARRGIFESHGLRVEVEETNPESVQLRSQLLASGADFATLSATDVLMARDEGFEITSVCMLVRKCVIVFFVHNDSTIFGPEDFRGKKIAVRVGYDEYTALLALLSKLGMDVNDVEVLDVGDDLSLFLDREVDVFAGHTAAEPILATCRGANVRCFYPEDYGVATGAEVVVTTNALCLAEPEVVQAFRNSIKQGWEFSKVNFEKAYSDLLSFTGPLDLEQEKFQKAMLRQMIALIFRDGRFPSDQKESDWEKIVSTYRENNLGRADFEIRDFLY